MLEELCLTLPPADDRETAVSAHETAHVVILVGRSQGRKDEGVLLHPFDPVLDGGQDLLASLSSSSGSLKVPSRSETTTSLVRVVLCGPDQVLRDEVGELVDREDAAGGTRLMATAGLRPLLPRE